MSGQAIQFNADLTGESSLIKSNQHPFSVRNQSAALYNLKGQRIYGIGNPLSQLSKAVPGIYLYVPQSLGKNQLSSTRCHLVTSGKKLVQVK